MDYEIVRRARRRSVSIRVSRDNQVCIVAPLSLSERRIREIIEKKSQWIQKQIEWNEAHPPPPPISSQEKEGYLKKAGEILEKKVNDYCVPMQLAVPRLRIRTFRSRWGSCSSRGILSFNWKLVLAPETVIDYVVVHELAHLKEMNHSSRFWAVVANYFPKYKEQKKWLRQNGHWLVF